MQPPTTTSQTSTKDGHAGEGQYYRNKNIFIDGVNMKIEIASAQMKHIYRTVLARNLRNNCYPWLNRTRKITACNFEFLRNLYLDSPFGHWWTGQNMVIWWICHCLNILVLLPDIKYVLKGLILKNSALCSSSDGFIPVLKWYRSWSSRRWPQTHFEACVWWSIMKSWMEWFSARTNARNFPLSVARKFTDLIWRTISSFSLSCESFTWDAGRVRFLINAQASFPVKCKKFVVFSALRFFLGKH